jgi:hypothetical protein
MSWERQVDKQNVFKARKELEDQEALSSQEFYIVSSYGVLTRKSDVAVCLKEGQSFGSSIQLRTGHNFTKLKNPLQSQPI